MNDNDTHDQCLSDVMCCNGSANVCLFLPLSLSLRYKTAIHPSIMAKTLKKKNRI